MSKASSIPQPSILLVEDHPGERQELEEHLHDVFPEARVESAESSEEAIQEFRKHPCDVLVIDIMLKKDTVPLGLDVVRQLKLLSDHPFRSVAYSGYPKDYRFEAGKVGFDAFVEKPRIDELIDAIHDLFELLVEHPSVPIGDVFCSMPFDKKALDVYLFGIKDAAQAAGFICRRNDEKTFTTDIVEEIKKDIQEADVIVADLTGSNPNVYYEVGYAHALEKEVVLVAQSKKDLKFNLKGLPCIIYKGYIHELRERLEDTLCDLGEHLKDAK